MTGRVSGYAPRNGNAVDVCYFRTSGDLFDGISFAFSARYEIASGVDRAVGLRAVGARLRWRWRRNTDDTVSPGRIAASLGWIADSSTSSSDGSQYRQLGRKRCV
jgi:hypothetical protein